MKHKGLIALAAIFAAGIVLTTFTSQILGVKEPVGTVQVPKTEMEESGVAVYGLDTGADGSSAPGVEAGDGTMSRKMAQDEAARPEMAMEETRGADGDTRISAYSQDDGNKEKQVSESSGEAVSISPLDPEPAMTDDSDGANIEMELTDGSENSSYYRNRLAELENRIQKNREAQNASNNSNSAKTLADSELKLWDNELNLIYNAVKDDLDDGEAADLVEEERAWIRERDRKAIDAAKASAGGSLESVEYTASLADSTRERAYELLDRYEDRIQ